MHCKRIDDMSGTAANNHDAIAWESVAVKRSAGEATNRDVWKNPFHARMAMVNLR